METPPTPPPPPTMDEAARRYEIEQQRMYQNMPLGFIVGTLAAVGGAVIWAVITVATGWQIGWMAVGVGFVVGHAVRAFGNGIDTSFRILGAALALFGCLLGNFLAAVGFMSQTLDISPFEVLSEVELRQLVDVMIANFRVMDLFFYGIAVYEGYRLSVRELATPGAPTEPA